MPTKTTVIDANTPMPDLLADDGQIKRLSAAEYDAIPRDSLRLWCHRYARYGLPTRELIDWLGRIIAGRRSIEIGSGSGDLAHHLGIPATDSRLQEEPAIAMLYRMTGQPTIRYPSFIEKLEAEDAINKYDPEIVIASWVTNWIDPDLPPPPGGGSVAGVHEDRIVARGIPYIMIGNLATHGHKPILKLPHQQLIKPWLRSRGGNQMLERIFVWNGASIEQFL